MICTYLSDYEGLSPTTNKDLNMLWADLRSQGRDWRVREMRGPDRRSGFLWRKRTPTYRYGLFNPLGGGEYQQINFWMPHDWSINPWVPAEMVIAYLYGRLSAPTPEAP